MLQLQWQQNATATATKRRQLAPPPLQAGKPKSVPLQTWRHPRVVPKNPRAGPKTPDPRPVTGLNKLPTACGSIGWSERVAAAGQELPLALAACREAIN